MSEHEDQSVIKGGYAKQTTLATKNSLAVEEAAGCKITDVAATTIYVADLTPKNAKLANDAYAKIMGKHKPVRKIIELIKLPAGAMIEVE